MKIRTLRVLSTPECNLNCYYCCREGYKYTGNGMNASSLLRFINILDSKIAIENIKFSGGEPLLSPHIVSMVDSVAKTTKYRPCIVTNGTNTSVLKKIISKTRAIQVAISLPSLTPNTYNKITNSTNQLDNVLSSIDFLERNEISHRLNVVINDYTSKQELKNIIDLQNSNGTKLRFIQMIKNKINHPELSTSSPPSLKTIEDYFKELNYSKDRETRSTIYLKNNKYHDILQVTKAFCHESCNECPSDKSCIWLASNGTIRTCAWGNSSDFKLKKWSTAEMNKVADSISQCLSR